jgi:tetratricopeptide (TPR) repeat protein
MAEVLNRRGVYDTALSYAKEAISLKPDYAFAMDTAATSYEKMERYTECVAMAKQAVQVSEGKFPGMHFRLGACYFDLEQWVQAGNSFRIAAEADKTDPAPAFNLALCLRHQGFTTDAKDWFREALHRNPDPDFRAKILGDLQ